MLFERFKNFLQILGLPGSLLFFTNTFLLIIGFTCMITSLIMNSKLTQIEEIIQINLIKNISILLLIIGVCSILSSVLTLIGIYYSKTIILKIYFVIIVLMFVALGIGLLVLISNANDIENKFKQELQVTIDNLNSNVTNSTLDCDLMRIISEHFQCCGFNNQSDFNNQTIAYLCCSSDNEPGCAQQVVTNIKDITHGLILIPTEILLGTMIASGLFAILMYLKSLKKKRRL